MNDVHKRVQKYLAERSLKARLDYGRGEYLEDALAEIVRLTGSGPAFQVAADALLRAGMYQQKVAAEACGLEWCNDCDQHKPSCVCAFRAREQAKREAEAIAKADEAKLDPAHAA